MSLSAADGLWLWIVVGVLSITGLTSIVLMLMMLLGRKASHHVTGLSFLVSVLAHLAFACAWFAWSLWAQMSPGAQAAENARERGPERESVQIDQIVTSDDPDVVAESTTTPLERLTEVTTPPEMARTLAPNEVPFPSEAPERTPNELPSAPIPVPDVPSRPEMAAAVPQPADAADVRPLTESRVPLEVESPQPERRPEIEIPQTPIERSPAPQVAQLDTPIERTANAGGVKRIDVTSDPLVSTPELLPDTVPEFQRTEATIDVTQQKGPTPSLLDEPLLGTEVPTPQVEGSPGKTERLLTDRTQLSDPTGLPSGTVERTRPSLSPTLPVPRREGFEVSSLGPSLAAPSLGSASPNVVRPDFDGPQASSASVPETYRLRSIERRSEAARKFGGTDESEKAVEASLAWLAANQERAGFWDADRHGAGNGPRADVEQLNLPEERRELRRTSGAKAHSGVTALALLSFLAAGYTNEEGQYAENIDRAIRWLVSQQRADGYLGGEATFFAQNYCHGMVTYALAEALGMQSNPNRDTELRDAVKKGVNYILRMQLTVDGGWRYTNTSAEGDMSLFGWQLMALKSAEIAGINIPDATRARLIGFLRDRSLGERKGLAAYLPGERPSPSMTAEALFCKQILGIHRSNDQSIEAVDYLLKHLPKRSEWNLYYWYYGTMSVYQFGGDAWTTWNASIRDELVAAQRTEGDLAGSWDPIGPWGPYGGRIYSTALATLCLEVYYRFLPLYEHGSRFEE